MLTFVPSPIPSGALTVIDSELRLKPSVGVIDVEGQVHMVLKSGSQHSIQGYDG